MNQKKKEQGNSNNFKKYMGEYRFDRATWSMEVYARSWEEAETKIKAMGSGKVLGEFGGEVPDSLGWLAKLIVWWKNYTNT